VILTTQCGVCNIHYICHILKGYSMRKKFTEEEMQAYAGSKYGLLSVQKVFRRASDNRVAVHATCECGGLYTGRLNDLRVGNTSSCGCLWEYSVKASNRSHGHSVNYRRSPTMASFHNMHTRCERESHPKYHNYGGRGIRVCAEWDDFNVFLSDMGECPNGMTLERVDVNLGYSKDNCIWLEKSKQALNKTNSVMLSYLGITKCLSEWCKDLGLSYSAIAYRIRSGWDVDRAFTQSIRKPK